MSDTAVDSIRKVDQDMGTGDIDTYLTAAVHLRVPPGNPAVHGALESAAQTSLAAFDAAVADTACFPVAARTFYASLPPAFREGIRKAALRR